MKKSIAAGLAGLSLLFAAGAALAQDKPSVDATPIGDLAAKPETKAILDKDVPGLTAHPATWTTCRSKSGRFRQKIRPFPGRPERALFMPASRPGQAEDVCLDQDRSQAPTHPGGGFLLLGP
jgi:hypothetical protein